MKHIKTRQGFYDETLAFLRKQGCRSFNSGCVYNGLNGTKCAIGYWIAPSKYKKSMEGNVVNQSIVFDILPKWIRELDAFFLEQFQSLLHDDVKDDNFHDSLEEQAKFFANEWNLIYTPPAQ